MLKCVCSCDLMNPKEKWAQDMNKLFPKETPNG